MESSDAVIRMENDELFSDSDSEYSKVEAVAGEKRQMTVLASSSISNQIGRFGGLEKLTHSGRGCEFELRPSPRKSPRTVKQLLHRTTPRKSSPIKSLSSPTKNHVPLTLEKRQDPHHIPYYLINFECILRGVIDETDDRELFEATELEIVDKFRALDLHAKKLYVRLFQRKLAWILRGSISYDEIPEIDLALSDLCQNGFLQSGSEIDDLETLLNLLPAPSVKKLCKEMNVGCKGSQKKDFVGALLGHSKQRSIFSGKKTLSPIILNK
jgi:hypothetical protein